MGLVYSCGVVFIPHDVHSHPEPAAVHAVAFYAVAGVLKTVRGCASQLTSWCVHGQEIGPKKRCGKCARATLMLIASGAALSRIPDLHARIWPGKIALRQQPLRASRTAAALANNLARGVPGCIILG